MRSPKWVHVCVFSHHSHRSTYSSFCRSQDVSYSSSCRDVHKKDATMFWIRSGWLLIRILASNNYENKILIKLFHNDALVLCVFSTLNSQHIKILSLLHLMWTKLLWAGFTVKAANSINKLINLNFLIAFLNFFHARKSTVKKINARYFQSPQVLSIWDHDPQ